MLRKLHKKLILTKKILSVSADFGSALTLLYQFTWLSLGRYMGRVIRPFSCNIQVEGRTAHIYMTGTMGELLTLVDIFVDHSYEPERDEKKTLFTTGPKTILDLGANIGIASVWFALTYPKALIHAYEPNPDMYVLLKQNTEHLPHIQIFEKAISGAEGLVTFNQSEYSLESSIFSARESTAIVVPAITLDRAIAIIGESVDYIKIDIEGAEFDSLNTCTKLQKVRAIVGEAHTEQSGHHQEELSELLASFSILEIYNPNRDTVFGFYAAHTNAEENP